MTITRQLRFVKCPKPNLSTETNCGRDSITFCGENKGEWGEGKVLFSLKYVEKVKSKSGVAAVGAAVSGMMDHRALPGTRSSSQLHTHRYNLF